MNRSIFPGRYAARSANEFVLFRIGMRFNGRRGIVAALRTFAKMPGMLAEQQTKPEIGMLSTSIALSWPVIQITQFWRSFEDLERYATASEGQHTKAWRWFNKLGRANEGTGVWHETYRIAPGSFEAIYVNIPRYGLAQAIVKKPRHRTENWRRRSTICERFFRTTRERTPGVDGRASRALENCG